MDRLQRQLLAKVAAVPVGEKLPLSLFARELNCSTSVVISSVAPLVMSGSLDEATVRPPATAAVPRRPRDRRAYVDTINGRELISELRPFLTSTGIPPSTLTKRAIGDAGAWKRWMAGKTVRMTTVERVRAFVAAHASPSVSESNLIDGTPTGRDPAEGQAAPVPGAGDKAGAMVARCNPVAPAERPSGQELYDEILRFTASDGGLTLSEFAALLGRSVQGMANMARSVPKDETVRRAWAIIAGDRSPFVPTTGHPAPRIGGADAAAQTQELRAKAQAGAERRLPGETLADAVRRERSFNPHPGAVPEGIALTAHHPHARRFPGLAPDVWERVRNLAAETGEQPAALLGPLIERGIDAMQAEAGR